MTEGSSHFNPFCS